MNYINFCFLLIQIYFIVKYIKALKAADERMKDNELDYSDHEVRLRNLELRFIDLQNEKNS